MTTLTCEGCGRPLTPPQQRFCALACYHRWQAAEASTGIVARFWAKVHKTPTCWFWTGSALKGYGQFTIKAPGHPQRHVYAHRVVWEQTNGPITDNLYVLHKCDTPLCVRPDHLFLGTQAENLADARQKGRLVDGRHLIKVSEAGMLDIRANYQRRKNGRALAAKYGISLVHLLRIVNGTARVPRPLFERVPSRQVPIRGEVA